MRILVPIAMLVASLGAPPATAGDFDRTCAYFRNVAFNDLHTRQDETFRVVLARDCAAALKVYRLRGAGREGRTRAEAYLVRLHQYRWTLIDMASARYDAAFQGPGARIGQPGQSMVRQVSRTGAYLIARAMGLIGAQQEWRAWTEARLGDAPGP